MATLESRKELVTKDSKEDNKEKELTGEQIYHMLTLGI